MTNPVLQEIQNLSPAAQQALQQAHAATSGQTPTPDAQAPALVRPPQKGVPPIGGAPRIISQQEGQQSLDAAQPPPNVTPPGQSKMPSLPAPNMPSVQAPRGTVQGDQAEQSRLLSTGSGEGQISQHIQGLMPNHPTLGKVLGGGLEGLTRIGDTALSAVAPEVAINLPGTAYHHQMLVNQDKKQIASDVSSNEGQARTAASNEQTAEAPANDESRRALEGAQTGDFQAQADERLHPTPKTPATPFEAWAKQNPDAKVSDWFALQNENKPKAPGTHDDQYIKILQDRNIAAGMNPTDAYAKAYTQWTHETKIDPGVQRAEIYVSGWPVQVLGENGDVHYDTAGNAIHTGENTPGSLSFKVQTALDKDFTSGVDARTLNSFNTATAHLSQLGNAVSALRNGNTQLFNKFSQEYAKQTGSSAPTNFNAIRAAVAGEVSKVFKGGQATDAEIQEMNQNISNAQSPQQLYGVINTYSNLMASKRDSLKQQFEQGQSGKPNFSGESQPANNYEQTATGQGGHKIGLRGGKWYDVQTGKPLQ